MARRSTADTAFASSLRDAIDLWGTDQPLAILTRAGATVVGTVQLLTDGAVHVRTGQWQVVIAPDAVEAIASDVSALRWPTGRQS